MSSAFSFAVCLLCAALAQAAPLRVCAHPNNLPFSNFQRQGFENQLAEFIAGETGRPLQYVWTPRREGDIKTLKAGVCDLVMGTLSRLKDVPVTRPYYSSAYVFVTRRGAPAIRSFDDPRLKRSRIGIEHVLGADHAEIPAEKALAGRGLSRNIAWYPQQTDFVKANEPVALLNAVERGAIDVAVEWGPVAGYFAHRDRADLDIVPVAPRFDGATPLVFDISMAVRPGDEALRRRLNGVIARRQREIRAILRRNGIPIVAPAWSGGR